jgi:hypothetical protein
VATLASALAGSHLTYLNVKGNNLGDQGKTAMGNALLAKPDPTLSFLTCDEWAIEPSTTSLDLSKKGLKSADATLLAGVLKGNEVVSELNVSNCSMSTVAAEAFGGMLLVNKTLQTLDVSDNSFGKLQVGDQVKLKSSGEMKVVKNIYNSDTDFDIEGQSGWLKRDAFQWESQVPAFCAGVAASPSLISVSTVFRHARLAVTFSHSSPLSYHVRSSMYPATASTNPLRTN